MSRWGLGEAGPCMCGGCRQCLHDQGYYCGDLDCKVCGGEPEQEEESDDDETESD